MGLLLKLLVAAIGLMYSLIWIKLTFTPEAMVTQFALEPVGIVGLNSWRANVAVLFFAGALFCFMSLRANGRVWLPPAMVLIGGAALGRVVGLIMDGAAMASVIGLTFELVIIIVLAAAYRSFSPDTSERAE